ncbi:MAG: hypothetical protein KC591_06610 [Gemmatimonadetes bacterium]|nr:hypothetical protein [Gemmatimonadota bacterium]
MKRMIKLVLVVVALSVVFGSIDARADQLKWTRRVDPSWVEGDPWEPHSALPKRGETLIGDSMEPTRFSMTAASDSRDALRFWMMVWRGLSWITI